MKTITNLYELMLEQIRSIHDSETQLLNDFPGIIEKATSVELKQLLKKFLTNTNAQVKRIETVFYKLNVEKKSGKNVVMSDLIKATREMIENCTDSKVRDAGMIACIQCINHYEIANYGTACAYSNSLEHGDIANLLHHTLVEEKEMDRQLSKLAEEHINVNAKTPLLV